MQTFKTVYTTVIGDVVYKDNNPLGNTYHVVNCGKFFYVLKLSDFDLTKTHRQVLKTKCIDDAISYVKQHCPEY